MTKSNSNKHFSGKKGSKRAKRRGKKKAKNKPHQNKYAHKSTRKNKDYDSKNKTFRNLPIIGEPGVMIPNGTRILFHGRIYQVLKDTKIPPSGTTTTQCKLVHYE